ncbi:hypothetical protein, partial [Streptomyces sp. NPDC005969]|uniref:hypothetical protein n=1 Tax=Streptomyces sp. NPDC005969 TaxID=3156722 RepID=UPI0033C78302
MFLNTPARMPAVRQPWLRELCDRVRKERNTGGTFETRPGAVTGNLDQKVDGLGERLEGLERKIDGF